MIFELLAVNHGQTTEGDFQDPAFDLKNGQLVNFAGNITGLLGWRNYAAYAIDMHQVLRHKGCDKYREDALGGAIAKGNYSAQGFF